MSRSITETSIPDIEEGVLSFCVVDNVATVVPVWSGFSFTSAQSPNKSVFLFVETVNHDAAAHWVFESCVFLVSFEMLQKKYPDIKLYIKEPKTYKTKFCDFFGVPFVTSLVPGCTVVVPVPKTMMLIKTVSESFRRIIDNFWDHFEKYRSLQPKIRVLIMPRGKLENCKPNDRVIQFDKIFQLLADCQEPYMTLNTDETRTIDEQASKVGEAENVVLCSGSAFLINSLFLTKRKVIVIGEPDMEYQASHYPRFGYLYKKCLSANEVALFRSGEESALPTLRKCCSSSK